MPILALAALDTLVVVLLVSATAFVALATLAAWDHYLQHRR